MNIVTLIGNLTDDVKTVATKDGYAISKFSLALNRYYMNKRTNERATETTYIDIECFGNVADNVRRYVGKGSKIAVTGRLKQDNWKDQTGNHSKIVVYAENIEFIDNKPMHNEPNGNGGQNNRQNSYQQQQNNSYQQGQQPSYHNYSQQVPPSQQVPVAPSELPPESPF